MIDYKLRLKKNWKVWNLKLKNWIVALQKNKNFYTIDLEEQKNVERTKRNNDKICRYFKKKNKVGVIRMEGFRVYLYDKNGSIIGIFLAPSQKKFEADKLKYCSEYREGENFISYTEIKNPVLDKKTGELREMTISEQVQSGILILSDGQYLEGEEIKTVIKPNDWSIWDKNGNTWKVDNDLLNAKLKELREKALKDLAEAKSNFLNQPLKIEKDSEKYTFENNEKNRNSLSLKLSLMWTLEQDKIEKVKVLNDKKMVEFIELNRSELKVLAKKIQDIIEIADMAEQMAVVGISRYTIEQMLNLNVKDFFQN